MEVLGENKMKYALVSIMILALFACYVPPSFAQGPSVSVDQAQAGKKIEASINGVVGQVTIIGYIKDEHNTEKRVEETVVVPVGGLHWTSDKPLLDSDADKLLRLVIVDEDGNELDGEVIRIAR